MAKAYHICLQHEAIEYEHRMLIFIVVIMNFIYTTHGASDHLET